jgi:2-polyprenyl-6-methoxyphenol hydroxylase-like FAD-dependent oxidoreductase
MTASSDLPFIIVGGGIGGIAAAIALAEKGHPVHVFEQAPEFAEIGAGIQLGPNIVRALDRLGVKQDVLDISWFPDALIMNCALDGHQITRVPVKEIFPKHYQENYAVVHRADLHLCLLRKAETIPHVKLQKSMEVTGYEDTGKLVRAKLADGSTVEGRALIGCDGLWSKIRQSIVADGKPRVSGHIAFRAVLPRNEVPEDLWGPDVVLWAGPRTHLVHYPLRRGELYNLVAVFHSDRYEEGWNVEASYGEMEAHFKGQRPEVLRLLQKIETWKMWVLCDREPVKNWTKGNVTLLGDAAHPTLQYLAQGANMATEDAVQLAHDVTLQPNDLNAAFLSYQQKRYLRTARIQTNSRVYGQFYHAAGVVAELRDQFFQERTPEEALKSTAWLYGGGDPI